MLRLWARALFVGALAVLLVYSTADGSVQFAGRLALSTDSAGQSYLQVVYDDATSLHNLKEIDDSETRLNALLDTEWEFLLKDGHRLLLDNRLRHGNTLTRDRLTAGYRYDSSSGARLQLDSESELERGEVFDRDETDFRQAIVGRWVQPLGGRRDRIEIYGRAELRRVTGDTLFFPQSYDMGKAKVSWSRDLGLLSTIDLGYSLGATAVVDSAPGSYVEHEISALIDAYAGSSFYVSAEALAARRNYIHSDSSSATGWAVLSSGTARYSPSLAVDLEARPKLEIARHDRPDFVYFNYHKAGLEMGARVRSSDTVGWEVLPGGELLRAPESEREDYDQIHLSLGLDVMAPGLWLDISYRVGRRDYASPAQRDDLQSVPRSDYTFADLLFLAEKRLWGPLSLRMTASHNVEWHELEEDDVTVFLVSSEISYRF